MEGIPGICWPKPTRDVKHLGRQMRIASIKNRLPTPTAMAISVDSVGPIPHRLPEGWAAMSEHPGKAARHNRVGSCTRHCAAVGSRLGHLGASQIQPIVRCDYADLQVTGELGRAASGRLGEAQHTMRWQGRHLTERAL
jgi:hypothetical protein